MSSGTDRLAGGAPSLFRGVAILRRGLHYLRRQRELWVWALLPFAINLLAFAGAAWLFVENLDALTAWLGGWLRPASPQAWYEWIWVGPLRALAWTIRWLLVLVFAALVYLLFTLVGGVIAAPFLEVLSQRTERLATGRLPEGTGAGLRAALRSIWEEAKRVSFFIAGQLVFGALALVPVVGILGLGAGLVFAALFMALDYTAYPLDRRGLRFAARRRWLWRHRWPMVGFGSVGLLTYALPGLNFLCLPWLVVSGTLLSVEVGFPGDPGGASPETPRLP